MPIPGPRLPYAARAVGDLRPRNLSHEAEIWTILGGIFAVLAVLVAVIIGVWQIIRQMQEDKRREDADQRRHNRWYRKFGRMLGRVLWPFR